MKYKISGILSALVLSGFAFVGCVSEETPEMPAPDMELVPVKFNLKFSDMANETTRSLAPGYKFSDGQSISVLKCYVYNQANGSYTVPTKVEDIDIKKVTENRGGDITILLPKGQTYDVVFLGTSIPQTDASLKLYYNSTDRTLSVNYNLVSCNDEELDCFFAVQKNVTTETILDNYIELTRPFAQLNIGTGDYATYTASSPVKNVSVTVDGIYNKVNLMTGDVVGDALAVNFGAASIPTGQLFPKEGMTYLSMNYLLVNTRKLVDVTFILNHTDSSIAAKVIPIEKVAVERNYQTNLYGKTLLTEYVPE